MNWTMPYPWRSRRDRVRRINMSSEPGNESFFCALRPMPRILSLRRSGETIKLRKVNFDARRVRSAERKKNWLGNLPEPNPPTISSDEQEIGTFGVDSPNPHQ